MAKENETLEERVLNLETRVAELAGIANANRDVFEKLERHEESIEALSDSRIAMSSRVTDIEDRDDNDLRKLFDGVNVKIERNAESAVMFGNGIESKVDGVVEVQAKIASAITQIGANLQAVQNQIVERCAVLDSRMGTLDGRISIHKDVLGSVNELLGVLK